MNKHLFAGLVVVASPLLLAGCGSHSASGSSSSHSSASSHASSAKLFAAGKHSGSRATSSTSKTSSNSSSTSSTSSSSTTNANPAMAPTQKPADGKTLALKVYYTYYHQQGRTDFDFGDLVIDDVSGMDITNGASKAVTETFPANTYQIGAPNYATLTYQVIDDNTVRVFDVPDDFTDSRWQSDPSWAKQTAHSYLTHPHTMRVETPSNDILDEMRAEIFGPQSSNY